MTALPQTPFATHVRRLVGLGLPLVGTALAAFSIHMTDVIMLGWYDVTALAAATVATSIWFVVFVLGRGFAQAVVPLVAAAEELGDEVRARRVMRMALWLGTAYAALLAPVFLVSEPLFLAIGQTPAVAAEAQRYLAIAAWGLFPALAQEAVRALLAGIQRTGIQLWVTLGGVALNALVNYALIFGNLGAPELGIRGAAIASILVQAAQLLALAVYAHAVRRGDALFARLWRPDTEALAQVFRLGVPIGLTGLAEGGLFAASSVMMGWIGEIELAAHGIALQLTALFFMFHVGMSSAATIRAGGHFGRRNEPELRRGALAAFAVSFGFGALVVVLLLAVPGPMVGLFVDPDEPARDAVIEIGIRLVMLAALFQFVDAAQIVAISLLRGVQDTNVPMWLAAVSYWLIGIPASYVMAFSLGWGAEGLWLGLTVGLLAAAVSLSARFWRRSVRIAVSG
ncbi:MAG: multidrug resistance protein, MATE family [Rhodobacteraceae bacterium HLUCCA08]|nr:MAG: multidrug resistance protein, MATE family [Rhodobacteraceae bacterium HLUCCA08]